MLLFIAFACFALLFAGWIMAPNRVQVIPSATTEPSSDMAKPQTSPA